MNVQFTLLAREFKRQSVRNKGTGCWEWCGPTNTRGYGQYCSAYKNFGILDSTYSVYRLSYIAYTGKEIPKGMCIRHTCHNPPCWNPKHLKLGTPKENTQDAVKANRMNHGEQRYNAKLTEADVTALLAEAHTMSQRALAMKYGITQTTCKDILHGKKWRHIARSSKYIVADKYKHRRKFNGVEIKRALERYSKREVLKMFNISMSYLNQIVRGERL